MAPSRSPTIASSQQSAGKTQKSISSFFSAKPAAPVKPKAVQPVEQPPATYEIQSSPNDNNDDYGNDLFVSEDEATNTSLQETLKRSLYEAADVKDENSLPDAKRLRYDVEQETNDDLPGDEDE